MPLHHGHDHGQSTDQVISELSSYLRGEIAACETYRQALKRISEPALRTPMEDCLRSHERRCYDVSRRIRLLGGEPPTESGPWGAFARLIEGGAKAFGARAAIIALETGEDHGLADYRRGLAHLDTETRAFVLTHLLREQEKTHAAMSALKHSFH